MTRRTITADEIAETTNDPAVVAAKKIEALGDTWAGDKCWRIGNSDERFETEADADAVRLERIAAIIARHREQREKRLVEALRAAHSHVVELREAWRSGALSESDGRGGERSNRNVEVETSIRQALKEAGYDQ